MGFPQGKLTIAASGALCGHLALTVGAAQAQDKTFTMKITTPTLHAALDHLCLQDTCHRHREGFLGGRIKVEVYPASQLGAIPAADRRCAVRCHPVRGHSAGIFCRPRRTLRGAGRAGARHLAGTGPQGRGRSRSEEILSWARRRQRDCTASRWPTRSRPRCCRRMRSAASPIFKGKKLRIFASKFQSASSSGWAQRRLQCRRAT